jgi:hypothetical protein
MLLHDKCQSFFVRFFSDALFRILNLRPGPMLLSRSSGYPRSTLPLFPVSLSTSINGGGEESISCLSTVPSGVSNRMDENGRERSNSLFRERKEPENKLLRRAFDSQSNAGTSALTKPWPRLRRFERCHSQLLLRASWKRILKTLIDNLNAARGVAPILADSVVKDTSRYTMLEACLNHISVTPVQTLRTSRVFPTPEPYKHAHRRR